VGVNNLPKVVARHHDTAGIWTHDRWVASWMLWLIVSECHVYWLYIQRVVTWQVARRAQRAVCCSCWKSPKMTTYEHLHRLLGSVYVLLVMLLCYHDLMLLQSSRRQFDI